MKDDIIKFRVEKKEKIHILITAKKAGFESMSAYLLFLHRQNSWRKVK